MRRRNFGPRPVITSIKNQMTFQTGITDVPVDILLAKAVTTPSPTVATDVSHGCIIKAIFLSFDFCGTLGSGTLNSGTAYLAKNPGDNLSLPSPESVGGSNEKKFVIRMWRAMIMRNQDGNVPYHWEGWIKIPRRYHRMGTDDTWRFLVETSASGTGHAQIMAIYKWYR